MRVLVIDDEQKVLAVTAAMLHEQNHETCVAANAGEAVNLIAELKFDIVVIDYNLGAINGIELMSKIKADNPDLYFIVMTGAGSTELAISSLKKGASDYLCKPFTLHDLRKSIDYVEKKIELDLERKRLFAGLTKTVREKTEELHKVNLSVLSTLAQAMEKRDFGTFGHSRRVSEYSCLIARKLGLGEIERLQTTALLHDIGKIGISDFIIGKNGTLNDEEIDIIRSHPRIGVEILSPLKQLEPMLPGILYHHERYDGSGYPERLEGEHIPLHARIIAVADTYDAILSDRPYRPGANHVIAVRELMKHSKKQFDPGVIAAFSEADQAEVDAVRGNADMSGNIQVRPASRNALVFAGGPRKGRL